MRLGFAFEYWEFHFLSSLIMEKMGFVLHLNLKNNNLFGIEWEIKIKKQNSDADKILGFF